MDDTGSYARDLLEGIARHQRESPKPWSLHLVRRRRFELPPECLNAWTGDGVIARVDSLEVELALKRTGLPVVNVSGALENPYFPTFVQDPVLAARLALGCFDERGHRHHAFIGDSLQQWSLDRLRHFDRLLCERGDICRRLLLHPDDLYADRAVQMIHDWLRKQPRPLAVWAGDDAMGLQVLNACLRGGLRVPDDVSVLGVDNDVTLTKMTTPPLSSLILNGEGAGFLAARALEQLMAGDRVKNSGVTALAPLGIAFRGSTDVHVADDPHVSLALKIIEREACRGLRVAELANRVPLARRQLETKFKAALGRTLLTQIRIVQCRKAQFLLETTDLTMVAVAERCGYEHLEHFSRVFKKVVGHTPGQHRRIKCEFAGRKQLGGALVRR